MSEATGDTPIADEVEKDLAEAQEEDLTHFDEDDDPQQFATGEFVDDEEDDD